MCGGILRAARTIESRPASYYEEIVIKTGQAEFSSEACQIRARWQESFAPALARNFLP